MYLKRLEIQGFKSFARKTVLEFEPGITAIVGPNGSGKSNVADSVRWVLGEQSAKMMRGKKSDDVIFAGSDKKTKLGFAEAIATFDNADRKIPVDSAEVSIARRVDRSGESEYLINGNRVRLLDIVDLVLKSNIGTSRYTVIGQGTIDQMILAGPSEIKNLLDEASGVKTYYIKRDKTLKRLETTAQNLMRAEDLVMEIEPRLKSLRRQAKRQESRAGFEAELKVYQLEWYSKQYQNLFGEIEQRALKLAGFAEKRKSLEENMQAHLRKLEAHEASRSASGGEFSRLRDELQQLQDQKNRLLENLSLIRGKMESFKTGTAGDSQTLTVELHGVRRRIEETTVQIDQAKKDETSANQNAGILHRQLEQLEQSLTSVYAALSEPHTVNWQEVTVELEAVEGRFTDFFDSLEQMNTIEEVRLAVTPLRQRFSDFRKKALAVISQPESSADIIQAELKELITRKEGLTRELHALESSVARTKISREFLEKQLEGLQQQALHINLELKKSTATSSDTFLEALLAEESKVKVSLEQLQHETTRIETAVNTYNASEEMARASLADDERRFRIEQDELGRLRDSESAIQVEKARLDTQLEALTQDAVQAIGHESFVHIQKVPITVTTEDLEDKIQKLKHQLDLIGGVDELTLQEYEETETRYGTLTEQITDLKRGIEDLRQIIDELDEHIRKQFNESFGLINEKFEFYFRMLFNGGRGNLTILRTRDEVAEESDENVIDATEASSPDTLRPEEKLVQKYEQGANNITGIDIKATPPGKKLSSIQALSGGERALTSIALLCAMLSCFPSPFVVLDEVDAALDDANTIRFGQILGTLAHQTQFVTITHNRETMSQANTLYGVTMGDDGISKLLSVKFDQATAFAK